MSKQGKFLIYCLEIYKKSKNLNGKSVIALFNKYAIQDYINSFYEALHATGEKYIINDIDLYIKARNSINN